MSTLVGEETISYFSSTIFFYRIERNWAKDVVVVVSFCSPFENIVKRLNFAVLEVTLWHCFGGTIVRITYGIL